jgi:hypothetical protein
MSRQALAYCACYVILTAKEELQSASCAAIKQKETYWQHPGSSWQKIDTRELGMAAKDVLWPGSRWLQPVLSTGDFPTPRQMQADSA